MPKVSIIIPCRNEERTIRFLLEAIYRQTFPNQDMEVVIADGLSEDRTREEIASFQEEYPKLQVHVIENRTLTIPAALNTAIAAAKGEIILRLDAHSVPDQSYIAKSVENLEAHKGTVVGGVWKIKAGKDTWIAHAIAAAAAHPLGVGDAKYRYSEIAEIVDTVPFGAYYKSLIDQIGNFDESLLSNEDYEFNVRVQRANGTIWLDPKITAIYFARPNLKALAKQYWRYGFWKVQMLRRYPDSLRWRQVVPPLFISSLLVLSLLTFWWPVASWILLLEVVLYWVALFQVGLQLASENKRIPHIIGVPMAIATMHFSWGTAFLWSLIRKKD